MSSVHSDTTITGTNNYKLSFRINTTIPGDISSMSLSGDGRWLLFSSHATRDKSALTLVDVRACVVHAMISTGKVWVTCVVWDTDTSFFAGFSDGRLFYARLLTAKYFLVFYPVRAPLHLSAITAISFNPTFNYLAFSTARELFVLCRYQIETDRYGFDMVGRVQPFDSGVYATAYKKLRLILADYDHKLGHCAVSNDGALLAASMLDHYLVIWPLQTGGPVLHRAQLSALPKLDPANEALYRPSVAITPNNVIVGGTTAGHLHFVRVQGRTDCPGHTVQALLAHKNCSTVDVAWENSQRHQHNQQRRPFVKEFNELVYGPPTLPTPNRHKATCRTVFALGVVVTIALVSVFINFYRWCIIPLECHIDVEDGSNIAFLGTCFIHFYLPRVLEKFATSVLFNIILLYRWMTSLPGPIAFAICAW
ncbi:hypothetical protein FRC06_007656 [Ceratobasidium sp. 370]|nr:hypothetical protein FRC06_007656 [Ceratobasidium sp. 370]